MCSAMGLSFWSSTVRFPLFTRATIFQHLVIELLFKNSLILMSETKMLHLCDF